MTYKEMIKTCEEKGIFPAQAMVAEEMACQLTDCFEIEYTDERFEELCEFAWYIYIKSEGLRILQICRAIARLEKKYKKTKKNNPVEMDKWEVMDLACWEE